MSNNLSRTTQPIALRLPKEVYATIERKAGKMKLRPSDWLKRRVIYDVCRQHRKDAI